MGTLLRVTCKVGLLLICSSDYFFGNTLPAAIFSYEWMEDMT